MSEQNRKLKGLLRDYSKLVNESYPFQADMIIDKACSLYQNMLDENPNEPEAVANHTRKKIYPSIAFYKAVLEIIGNQQSAYHLIADYFVRQGEDVSRMIQVMTSISKLYKLVPGLMSRIIRKKFGTASGFQMDVYPSQKGTCHIDMLVCPYFENCKKYGCPELTTAFCDSDDISYGSMHPNLIWGRTKTLGRGDDFCDFILETRR